MFTGIIEEIGKIKRITKNGNYMKLEIECQTVLEDINLGDSIAVNGVCLTANRISEKSFTVDVMSETVKRTSLASLKTNSKVNLERAMPLNGRFGGHIVSGHIDGVGHISKMKKDGNAIWIYIEAPKNIIDLIVMKGSITIDGISLTVAYLDTTSFAVSIIPHTKDATTLVSKKLGEVVNLENDIIGKYIRSFLTKDVPIDYSNEKQTNQKESHKKFSKTSNVSLEMLLENGF
ncbi:riboflavin synthase [Lachnobacterium bovis]|uniref:Riboflavin synthase n=1 Tax=Lachnobacterium bovis TaxID=140626 RepID=A0A1H9P7U0_9FIRM|nr:riboflavin synthase [Lachnobacterium bovis]SER43849.1 riboflavin synthase alpha chain [Lachnobacterium bovis]